MVLFAAYWVYVLYSLLVCTKVVYYMFGYKALVHDYIFTGKAVMFVLSTSWVINWIMIAYATRKYYKFKNQLVMTFFAPFYILTFPIVFVILKIFNSQRKW